MRKYAIITQSRCGYQLLTHLMNSNRSILGLGEIFSNKIEVRRKSLFNNRIHVLDEKGSAVGYVRNTLTNYANKSRKQIFGFKLNYTDCIENQNWSSLWDEIANNKWHIIHLTRSNALDRAISEKLANKQKRWNYKPYDTQVRITFKELEFHYNRSIKWQQKTNDRFRECPMYHLTYEELIRNKEDTCKKIQSFLGVKSQNLKCKLPKQRIGGQATFLINYRHLYSQCIIHPIYKKWLTDIPVI